MRPAAAFLLLFFPVAMRGRRTAGAVRAAPRAAGAALAVRRAGGFFRTAGTGSLFYQAANRQPKQNRKKNTDQNCHCVHKNTSPQTEDDDELFWSGSALHRQAVSDGANRAMRPRPRGSPNRCAAGTPGGPEGRSSPPGRPGQRLCRLQTRARRRAGRRAG